MKQPDQQHEDQQIPQAILASADIRKKDLEENVKKNDR